jgi:hypothetical protein
LGAAHRNPQEAAANVEKFILRSVRQLKKLTTDELLEQRYCKWRSIGYTDCSSASGEAMVPGRGGNGAKKAGSSGRQNGKSRQQAEQPVESIRNRSRPKAKASARSS